MISPSTRPDDKYKHWESLLNAPIDGIDKRAYNAVRNRVAAHARPVGSLGKLEELACLLAGIQASQQPLSFPRMVMMFCGDHGVAIERLSVFPPRTTLGVAETAAGGGAGINAFANSVRCRVQVIDVGINFRDSVPGTVCRRVASGTENFLKGPAMTKQQAQQAILAGANAAAKAIDEGNRLIAVGEMGNSNTTVASALLVSLAKCSAVDAVGRGTGVRGSKLLRKIAAVKKAVNINRPNRQDPLDCFAKLGGFELGAMAGAFVASAAARTPCVVDGFISTVSALLAVRLFPAVRHSLIFSHVSNEKGHKLALEELKARPMLDLGLRLGEGTGAIACIPLIDIASKLIWGIKTFSELHVRNPQTRT